MLCRYVSWYQAANGAISKGTSSSTASVTTKQTTTSIGEETVLITVSGEVENLALSTSALATNGWVVSANKAQAGTGADTLTGQFTVAASWTSTPADATLYNGESLTFVLTGTGMVKLRNEANNADVDSISVVVTVTGGALVISGTNVINDSGTMKVNFRVQTNNASGLEYGKTGDALAADSQLIPVVGSATSSDLYAYVASTYQIQHRADSSSEWENVSGMFLHDADGIAIDAA